MIHPFLPAAMFVGAGVLASSPAAALDNRNHPPPRPPQPLMCSQLAGQAGGLVGTPGIKSVASTIVPAAGQNVAYCQVNMLYGDVGDSRTSTSASACRSTRSTAAPAACRAPGTAGRRASAAAAAGQPGRQRAGECRLRGLGQRHRPRGGDCEPGVNLDGTYNLQFINDFIRNGMKQQILLSKAVAETYYAKKPAYNYWNGCSTGGRQGYVLAQELGRELDGILANAPAIYWTRFQTAQMWGQIVMKDLVGGPIAAAKLNQATASAVAACDAADGVVDGVIDDPRTCTFSAKANVCGTPDGTGRQLPERRRGGGHRQDLGRPAQSRRQARSGSASIAAPAITALNGTNPFALGVTQFHWDEHDRTFDWKTVIDEQYADVAQDGSRNIADVTDTFGDLDEFREERRQAAHLGRRERPADHAARRDQLLPADGAALRRAARRRLQRLQEFYRLFRAPGVGHCGGGVDRNRGLFDALVNWVENGVAPEQIRRQSPPVGGVTRTRPLCPYPQTAIYNGTGSTNDAANFHLRRQSRDAAKSCATACWRSTSTRSTGHWTTAKAARHAASAGVERTTTATTRTRTTRLQRIARPGAF